MVTWNACCCKRDGFPAVVGLQKGSEILIKDKIYIGDALTVLKTFPDESINCCVTSPPYWGLRDYGVDGQLGNEPTPETYVDNLVSVFREVKRILKKEGTLWLNLGDSYAGSGKGQTKSGCGDPKNTKTLGMRLDIKKISLKPKNLIGIPWMVAFALQADGWYLRQDIIWAKPNPMPESVKDRCTKSHEYIFLLSKSAKYYYDAEAISEPVADSTVTRVFGKTNGVMKAAAPRYGGKKYTESPKMFYRTKSGNAYDYRERRNKRDVWMVSTKPFKGAHFATFPPDLIEPCILAGCPVGGVVLDPFIGSGTVGVVAKKHGMYYAGIDINEEYAQMSQIRIGGG